MDISPEDYTETKFQDCHILFESAEESSRFVQLGMPFLKAGYVRLDYENNQINLGNKDVIAYISKPMIHPVGPEIPVIPKENKTEPVVTPV
jgi:hypothetical protein